MASTRCPHCGLTVLMAQDMDAQAALCPGCQLPLWTHGDSKWAPLPLRHDPPPIQAPPSPMSGGVNSSDTAGLNALVLAAIALSLSLLGLCCLPISALGGILAVVGLIIASSARNSDRKRLALYLNGAGVVIAILVTLLYVLMFFSDNKFS